MLGVLGVLPKTVGGLKRGFELAQPHLAPRSQFASSSAQLLHMLAQRGQRVLQLSSFGCGGLNIGRQSWRAGSRHGHARRGCSGSSV